MKTSLSVGISNHNGYKKTFLNYCGISHKVFSNLNEGTAKNVKVFIWTSEDAVFFSKSNKDKIVVITENRILSKIFNLLIQKKNSFYFKNDNGLFGGRSFYMNTGCDIIDLLEKDNTICDCYDSSNTKIKNSGIIIKEYGNILFISLPWNVFDVNLGSEWGYRPFYSKYTKKHFTEVGPKIDYSSLRRLLLEIVKYAFKYLGLPFVKLEYPFKSKPSFAFRIDADGFSKESMDSVLRIAKSFNATFTWFIDVEGWGRNLTYINELSKCNQDIQLHCYKHMTYQSILTNSINLKKGIKNLNQFSVIPNSIVSPFGYWFKGYQESIKKLLFRYSSEFAFNTDDLPSYPYNDNIYPLQVPVHCGSIGVFEENGFDREEIFSHLSGIVEDSIKDTGYAIIYDHPLKRIEKYENEFRNMFSALTEKGYTFVRLDEIAERFMDYLSIYYDPVMEDNMLKIESGFNKSKYIIEVYNCSNNMSLENSGMFRIIKNNSCTVDEYLYPGTKLIKNTEWVKQRIKPSKISFLKWYLVFYIKELIKILKTSDKKE